MGKGMTGKGTITAVTYNLGWYSPVHSVGSGGHSGWSESYVFA